MGDGRREARPVGEASARLNRAGTSSTWLARDELVIAPTAAGDSTPRRYVAGDPVPTVTGPNGVTYRAEVANLTRNVMIEGTPGGRTHVFVRSTSPQSIRNVAIRYVGPQLSSADAQYRGVPGRYGLDFHHSGDGSRGSVVSNVVVRDCGNNGFVTHSSHGVTYLNPVAYDVWPSKVDGGTSNSDGPGGAYWWDSGHETNDLTYWDALALGVYGEGNLAGFVLGTGANLTIVDSAAAAVGVT